MSGNLSVERYACVTWEVPDFFKLSTQGDYYIESPRFCMTDIPYRLRLYPNFMKRVAFRLKRLSSYVYGNDVSYKIGYRSITGKEVEIENILFSKYGRKMFTASRSVFENENDIYVPGGTLTVFCRMRLSKSSIARRLDSEVGETSFADLALSSQQDKKHGVIPSMDKLQSDYRHLLLKGAESDACLVVCGKEFKVHRNILRSRSPVFDDMFDHDTAEKDSGRVVIDDLDPDSFPEFLEYVYTGRVETFSDVNAFGLYVAADKYQLDILKAECVEYIRKNMSVDSFCDAMTLALRHHETDLMEQSVAFFKKNLDSIILTANWQEFMSENSTRANELLIKALVPRNR